MSLSDYSLSYSFSVSFLRKTIEYLQKIELKKDDDNDVFKILLKKE